MVGQAIGHQFQHGATVAGQRTFARLQHGGHHRDQIVAVHLQAMQAASQALLCQRLGTGLGRTRDRDGPAVVDDAQDQRQLVGTGRIQCGVEVGLGTAAVAAHGHRDLLFLVELELQRSACGVQALGGNRHAEREVLGGIATVVVAALVAAPVHQHVVRAHATHEHGAVLAVGRCEHVVLLHRGADAHMRGFVAEAGGVGAQLAGALQRDRLAVEHAHEQHLLEHRQQRAWVAQGFGQVIADERAVRVQILQVFDLELSGNRHCVLHLRQRSYK
ncbi:hypothetical protein D3C73_864530 [compost metagenome]